MQGTFLNRIFNSFSWFYATHLLMTIAVVTLLVFHPLLGLGHLGPARINCEGPATASFGNKKYHGITWVSPTQHTTSGGNLPKAALRFQSISDSEILS